MNNEVRESLVAQAFEYNGIYVSVDKSTQKSRSFTRGSISNYNSKL